MRIRQKDNSTGTHAREDPGSDDTGRNRARRIATQRIVAGPEGGAGVFIFALASLGILHAMQRGVPQFIVAATVTV